MKAKTLTIFAVLLLLPVVSAYSGSSTNYEIKYGTGMGLVAEHSSGNYKAEGIMVNEPVGEHQSTNYQLCIGPYSRYFIKGDVKFDCEINIFDLAITAQAFGKEPEDPGYYGLADLNNDGTINILDIILVATNYGSTC